MKHVTTLGSSTRHLFGGRLFVIAVAMLFIAAMTTTAWGQQLMDENFGYSTGQLTSGGGGANVSGGNWVNFSGTALYIQVASGSLSYTDYAASGLGNMVNIVNGSAEDAYRGFTSQTSGTVYASFLVRVDSTTSMSLNSSTTGDYFAGFLPSTSTTALVNRVSTRQGSVAGTWQIGVRATSTSPNTTAVFSSTDLSTATTYLVVIGWEIVSGAANDTANLWLNPTLGGSEPAPLVSQVSASDNADFARFFLRQGTNTVDGSVDGIRVGTTWADVTGIPAAPSATTGAATSITSTTATLNGTVNPNYDSTTVIFDYGTTIGYGSTATATQSPLGSHGTATAVSAPISGLTQNQEYHFRDPATNSVDTTNGGDLTFTTLPSAPTTTAATSVTNSSFTANWTAGAGNAPTGYRLDVATDTGFTSFVAGYTDLAVAGTSQSVTGLSGGTTYYYRARAEGPGGTSANSNTTSQLTAPDAPTATAATSIGASSFTANWTAPGGTVDDYRLDVSTDNAFGSFVSGYSNLTVAGTSQVVSGLSPSTEYFYRVRAVNTGGTSANSNTDSATTLGASAPSLANPTATSILTTTATLGAEVTDSNNAVLTERGVVWALTVDPTTADTKIIEGGVGLGVFTVGATGLPAGTLVHYRGYAINSQGTGYSSDATFYTLDTEPTTHAGSFSATATGSTTIDLSWTVATGADGYIVLQRTGADPTGTPSDATGYSVGNSIGDGTVAAIITSGATTSTTVSGLTGGTDYHFSIMPFAWDGANAATYNYKTDPTIPTDSATTNSAESDVIATGGFGYSSNIAYTTYTGIADITDVNSVAAFGVTVRDGGAGTDADALATTLTDMSFSVTNSSFLSRAALYDGVTELAEVAVSGGTVTFSGLSAAAADGGTKDLTLRVVYSTTVTDNGQNGYTVSAVTAAVSGSGFAAANGGGATSSVAGDDNRVEVTATKLTFSPNVANAPVSTNFTATARAYDANNNTDLDYTGTVTFSKNSGPGTLSGTTAVAAVSGVATTTDLQFDAGGTYTLRASDGSLTDGISNSFVITSPATFKVAGPGNIPDANFSPLAGDTLDWDSPSTWTVVSGGDANGIPEADDDVIIDNTFKAGSYFITAGVVKPDSCRSILVGGPGASSVVTVLVPKTSPLPGLGGGRHALTFGNNAAGNYDAVIDNNGVVDNAYPNQNSNRGFNILGFGAAGDSVLIKPGGKYIHRSRSSVSGVAIGLSKDLTVAGGTFEFDVPKTGSNFFVGFAGIVYPTLVLSANDSALTYNGSSSQASSFGSTFIKGDLTINTGANLRPGTGGSYEGDFFVRGNIVNNGTIDFSSNSQNILAMIGPSAQTISGNAPTLGKGIFIGNAAGVSLSTNLNVTGGFVTTTGSMNYLQPQFPANIFAISAAGVLNTGASTVFLNPGGSMSEGTNPVQGNASATRTASMSVNETFGNIGYEINAAGGAPGSTTVLRKTGVASTGNGNQSILRYYDVSPANNSSLNATLNFSYVDGAELNGITETDLLLQKSTDGGTSWSGKSGSQNTVLNKITATGVNSFSRWTAASVNAPLFITHTITVRKFQDLDGDINTAGDQTAKKWRMSLYRDSISAGTLISSSNLNSGIHATANLEAGTYIACEEDSAGWLHIGKKRDGTPYPGSYKYDTVTVSGGVGSTIDFFNQKVSSISILKFKDTDGDPNTIESAKSWHLALYAGSIAPANLVGEADTDNLTLTGLQAGTYIACEADSGASWVRLNGNGTRYDTLVLLADQTVVDTFINFRPNSITVRKYQDADGDFNTVGDRVLKAWYLEVVGEGNNSTGTLTVNNLGDGIYTAQEADSAGWIHLGYVVDGVPTASTSNNVNVNVADGDNAVVDFVNAPPIYSQAFRSFRPDSIANDKDNKGKVGKYVKRKPVRSDFCFFVVATDTVNDLHVEFSQAIELAFPFYTEPPSTASNPDTKLKKWDFTFSSAILPGDTVVIYGFGNKGKQMKVGKYYWTLNGTQVGLKLKDPTFTRNDPRLPMPNRINALFETFEQGGYTSTNGLVVGIDKILPIDSSKQYGWLRSEKYKDVLKSLSDKTGLHTGDPGGFDVFSNNGKPLIKRQKSLPPTKHNNKLLANMIALKVNIVASQLAKTPVGFGELIYDEGSNALDGMMVKDIASYGDNLMMGYYDSTGHKFADTSEYNNLNNVIDQINSAFEGPVDSIDFTVKLHLKGTKQLIDVPYLKANPNIAPVTIAPTLTSLNQIPDAYSLYQNYPNPFNPTTTIAFDLPEEAFVTLKVYNLLGQEVATLLDREQMDEGTQELQFNAGSLASGMYFYRIVAQGFDDDGINTNNFTTVKKMLLVK